MSTAAGNQFARRARDARPQAARATRQSGQSHVAMPAAARLRWPDLSAYALLLGCLATAIMLALPSEGRPTKRNARQRADEGSQSALI